MSGLLDTGVGVRQVSGATPGLDARRLPFTDIPVIDFSAMSGSDEARRTAVAQEIDAACTNVGFFYLSHHGVDMQAVDKLFAASRWFFSQSIDYKRSVDISQSAFNRGYIPMCGEKNNAHSEGDLKETFDLALELDAGTLREFGDNPLYGPNQWPADAPHFRATLDDFYAAMTSLTEQLYAAFAIALGLAPDHFRGMLARPLDILRLLRYPPQPVVERSDQIGTGAHSDFDCFTLLCQDPTGGLQALNSAGEWIDAQPIEGTFLVNVGDMLERWTNGRYVSTVHRVINRSERERYSCVFFAAPDYDTVVECLPSCRAADGSAGYPPIRAGDYIIERYNEILV